MLPCMTCEPVLVGRTQLRIVCYPGSRSSCCCSFHAFAKEQINRACFPRLCFTNVARHTVHTPLSLRYFLSSRRRTYVQIIHFCSSPKPWEEAKRKGDLEMIWWQRYVQMKMGSMPGTGGF